MTDQPNLFRQELGKFLEVYQLYSKQYFDKKIKGVSSYPQLIPQFYKDLYDFGEGGKKMRAFLVALGYQVGGGHDLKKIMPICLAVEMIHNFLLIHDDIVDKSATRRKKPTIHKRYEAKFGEHYGVSQAIVIGDIACLEAISLVNSSDFSDTQKTFVVREIKNILIETLYGEALDVDYSYRKAKIADIWQVVDLKTARYSFVGPFKIGTLLGGVSKDQIVAARQFGLTAGKAFQLQDDILGVFGDEKILGKSVITDLQEGKNTVLIFKTKELATETDLQKVTKIWGNNEAKIKDLWAVRKIIESSGALAWCEQEKQKLIRQAKAYINKITPELKLRQILGEIADFAVSRKS